MTEPKHLTNFISIWIVQILRMAVPVVIILLMGRFYKVEEFGHYSVATSFMGVFGLFLTFGVANAVGFDIAGIDNPLKSQVCGVMLSGLIALAIFSIIGCSVIAIVLSILNYRLEILFLIVLLGIGYWIMGVNSVITAVFWGLKKMSYMAVSAFAVLIANFIFVIPLIFLHRPLWEVAISWSFCQIIGLLVSGWQLYKRGFFLKPKISKKQIHNLVKRSIGIGFDSVIFRLGANLTNIVLPLYLTGYQIGIFNGAFKPFTLLVLGNQVCIRYFTPYIASARYGNKEAIANKLALFHKISTFFTLTILMLPLFFAETLCRTIYGDQLAGSAHYMQMLSLGYLLYYLPPYSSALKALGFEWKVLWSSVTQVAVNLVCFFVFVPIWGIKGAVVSVILAYCSYWICCIFVYRIVALNPITNILNYLFFLLATASSGWIIYRYFTQGLLGIMSFLLLSSFLSCVVYWNRKERGMAVSYIKKAVV